MCWEYNATEKIETQRFLESVEDKFLMQLMKDPTTEGAQLGLLLVNSEGLDAKVELSDHEQSCDSLPDGFICIHHHPLGLHIQPHCYPEKHPPTQAMSSQFLQKDSVSKALLKSR